MVFCPLECIFIVQIFTCEVKEEDKAKTAFKVGTLGFFEFNRMPFGLCNSPATFQRLMERSMGDINLRDCLIYLDDIVVFSTTFEEHVDRLEAVFKRLKRNNLKLKASKCEFFKREVTYLGHVVSQEGIQTDPSKIDAVKTWPVPKTVKEVLMFLGFTGYYRTFVKGFLHNLRRARRSTGSGVQETEKKQLEAKGIQVRIL